MDGFQLPVEQVASSQANLAVVLAGFAFAGFVLLLNHLGNLVLGESQSGTSSLPRDRSGDPHFQTMYLLIASFSMGVLAAYLFASSETGDPWSTYYGYEFAHVALGVELLALIAAVNLMIGVHASAFARQIAWTITVLMCLWITGRVLVESARAEALRVGSNGLVWADGVVVTMTVTVVLMQTAGLWLAMSGWPERLLPLRAIMFFAVGVGVVGSILALAHTVFSIGMWQAGGLPRWVDAALVAIAGLMSAWTLVLSHPDMNWTDRSAREVEARTSTRRDGGGPSEDA